MKPLKLDADSSRTGKLEDMNAPWSRLLPSGDALHLPETLPPRTGGRRHVRLLLPRQGAPSGSCTARRTDANGRWSISAAGMYSMRPRHWPGFDDPDARFYCMEDVELYRFPGTLLHDPRFVAEYPELIINLMVSMSTKVLVMHANLSETGGGTAVKQVSLFLCGLHVCTVTSSTSTPR